MSNANRSSPAHPTGKSPVVIAIAGPSCSGKTELAHRLCAALKEHRPALFPFDGYYLDLAHLPMDEITRHNFDSPGSLDESLLKMHLRTLARGGSVERPCYDYATHRRTGTQRLDPGELLIAEGLFALYWEDLLPLYAMRIYVDLDDAACLKRRQARDERERGASPEFTLWQWAAHVKPMADAHIRPTLCRADLVLDGAAPLGEIAARAARHILPLLPPPPVI